MVQNLNSWEKNCNCQTQKTILKTWPPLFKGLINFNPTDNAIVFPNTYPLNGDLSGRQPYPMFEQPGLEMFLSFTVDMAMNYPVYSFYYNSLNTTKLYCENVIRI